MKILLLGPERKEMMKFITSLSDEVQWTDKRLSSNRDLVDWADYIISYGYNYIIRKKLIDQFRNRAINLHIAYLPWCRGSYPNLWSFLYDTPKGVTIHFLDSGVDTGDIIVQEKVPALPDDTLRTSHDRLIIALERLFKTNWPKIRAGQIIAVSQPDGFPIFRERDRDKFGHLLEKGWDTPVAELIGKGLEMDKS